MQTENGNKRMVIWHGCLVSEQYLIDLQKWLDKLKDNVVQRKRQIFK